MSLGCRDHWECVRGRGGDAREYGPRLMHTATTELWRRITFYVCCPALVATGIYVYKAEMAHKAHYAELV